MKPLSKWQIEVWRRLLDGSVVFTVLHNADNRGNRTGHVHLASNRSAIPEKAPDETLVHNDYRGRVAYIALSEIPAFDDPDSHELEISWRNGRTMEQHLLVACRNISFHFQLILRTGIRCGQWNEIRIRDRSYSRQGLHAFAQRAAEIPLFLRSIAGVR